MSKKITFVPYSANISVNDKIIDINYVLGKLHKHLASANEATLTKAREYQVKGADWKRVQALEEADKYIKASKLPSYLHDVTRKAAYDSVDNEYIITLASLLDGMPAFTEENISTEDGFTISDAYRAKMREEYRITLTEEQTRDVEIFRQLCELYTSLSERYMLWRPNSLPPFSLGTDEELAERLLAHCKHI